MVRGLLYEKGRLYRGIKGKDRVKIQKNFVKKRDLYRRRWDDDGGWRGNGFTI